MLFQSFKTFVAASCVLATTTICGMQVDKPHLSAVGALRFRAMGTDQFNNAKRQKQEKPECSICLEPVTGKDGETTKCGHLFHKKCLAKWLKEANTCPLCRKVIREDQPQGQNKMQIVQDFFEGRRRMRSLLQQGNQLERMQRDDKDLPNETIALIAAMEDNNPAEFEDRLIIAFAMMAAGPDLGFRNVQTENFQNFIRSHVSGLVKEDLKDTAAGIVERWCTFHS